MIKVRFSVGNRQLKGFEISGHAMYAESGSDIVCASVSSAAYMAANTITDVIGADADAAAGDGTMSVTLNQPNEQAQAVLRGLELHLTELSKQYPQNIKLIYGGVKNA
ncbi:MAG: ribosomal-processing cysteine protease Prp [Ruminococcaceae bacterium]|nr:ribosomal-processing cysteine protease Prp [Oscillospiraceae bacterium]MBR4859102.1 ribosomal-processing cysteine protease Prp [Clostridia bacterium]